MTFMFKNERKHPIKGCLRNCENLDADFVRACAVEINIESQNGISAQTKPPAQSTSMSTPPSLLPQEPLQCSYCWGNNKIAGHGGKFNFWSRSIFCSRPIFGNMWKIRQDCQKRQKIIYWSHYKVAGHGKIWGEFFLFLCGSIAFFFNSAGARDKWSQSPIKETKMNLCNTLYTRKPQKIPTSHSENPN